MPREENAGASWPKEFLDAVPPEMLATDSVVALDEPESHVGSRDTVLSVLREQLASAFTEISSLKSSLELLEQEHRDYQLRANQVLAQRESSLASTDDALDVAAALRSQINAFRNERAGLRAEIAELKSQADLRRGEHIRETERAGSAESLLAELRLHADKQSEELAHLKQQLAQQVVEAAEATRRWRESVAGLLFAKKEAEEQRQLATSLQGEVAHLRTRHAPSPDPQLVLTKQLADQLLVKQAEIDRLTGAAKTVVAPQVAVPMPPRRRSGSSPLAVTLSQLSFLFPKSPLAKLFLLGYTCILQVGIFVLLFRGIPSQVVDA